METLTRDSTSVVLVKLGVSGFVDRISLLAKLFRSLLVISTPTDDSPHKGLKIFLSQQARFSRAVPGRWTPKTEFRLKVRECRFPGAPVVGRAMSRTLQSAQHPVWSHFASRTHFAVFDAHAAILPLLSNVHLCLETCSRAQTLILQWTAHIAAPNVVCLVHTSHK